MTTALNTILAKDDAGTLRLWACRGEGKGCARNKYRKAQKPCADCYGPLEETMTLEEVQRRLTQGDA